METGEVFIGQGEAESDAFAALMEQREDVDMGEAPRGVPAPAAVRPPGGARGNTTEQESVESIEKASTMTLLAHQFIKMGMQRNVVTNFFPQAQSAKFLREMAVSILQNLKDSDTLAIDGELLTKLEPVAMTVVRHYLSRRAQTAAYFTPVNAYEALMRNPFAVPIGVEYKQEKDRVHQISVFQCGGFQHRIDMTSVETIYKTWGRLLEQVKKAGTHLVEMLPNNKGLADLAYFASENIVSNPGSTVKFTLRNKKEYEGLVSFDDQVKEANIIQKLMDIANTVAFSYPYQESDRKVWYYVMFHKCSAATRVIIDNLANELVQLQMPSLHITTKIKHIFSTERDKRRGEMAVAIRDKMGDPFHKEMKDQFNASNQLYPQGGILDATMADAFAVASTMSFPKKTSDMATIVSLMLAGAKETSSEEVYFWGFPKPDVMEIIRDMRKESLNTMIPGGEGLHKLKLFWVTNSAVGADVGVEKIAGIDAKIQQATRTTRALNFIFDPTAYTGLQEKGMDALIRNIRTEYMLKDAKVQIRHVSYMVRHDQMKSDEYISLIDEQLTIQGIQTQLIHHPRLNSSETYLMMVPLLDASKWDPKVMKNKVTNMVGVYCADHAHYSIEFSKLRDRMIIGSQIEKYQIMEYLGVLSTKYYGFINYAQNFAWRFQARKKMLKQVKTSGATGYGELMGTLSDVDYSFDVASGKDEIVVVPPPSTGIPISTFAYQEQQAMEIERRAKEARDREDALKRKIGDISAPTTDSNA